MLLRAVAFKLTDRKTGERLGRAAIAPDARYISIEWSGANTVEHRMADPDGWRLLSRALEEPLPRKPLDSTNVIVRMLLPTDRRQKVAVQPVTERLVEVVARRETRRNLDTVLRKLAL
jgi:hypothetical protein